MIDGMFLMIDFEHCSLMKLCSFVEMWLEHTVSAGTRTAYHIGSWI